MLSREGVIEWEMSNLRRELGKDFRKNKQAQEFCKINDNFKKTVSKNPRQAQIDFKKNYIGYLVLYHCLNEPQYFLSM